MLYSSVPAPWSPELRIQYQEEVPQEEREARQPLGQAGEEEEAERQKEAERRAG